MKTTPFLFRSQRGSTIQGVAITLGFALAAAFVLAWYLFTKTQRLERALETAKQEKIAGEVSQLKSEEESRKTVGRIQQEQARTELRAIEARLITALAKLAEIDRTATELRIGEEGRKLALSSTLLRQAEHLFDYSLKELPTAETIQGRVEAGRRLLLQIDQGPAPVLLDDKFRAQLAEQGSFAKATENSLATATIRVSALQNEAKVAFVPEGRALPVTLEQAMRRAKEAESARLTRENANIIGQARAEAERSKAKGEASQIKTEAEIVELKRQGNLDSAKRTADQTIATQAAETRVVEMSEEDKRAAMLKKAEWERKLAEAKRTEVAAKLQPFVTPGYWQPGDNMPKGVEKIPVSLAKLRSSGALNKTSEGLRKLAELGVFRHNDRPRWERHYAAITWQKNAAQREELIARQQLLIAYGEALVELGLLFP